MRKGIVILFVFISSFSYGQFNSWFFVQDDITTQCGGSTTYSGGYSYPSMTYVNLGSSTGSVSLYFQAGQIPDWCIVEFNGSIVVNNGYIGHISYDLGGFNRIDFKNSLLGKIDPIYGTIYPDFTHYIDDGYPRITITESTTTVWIKSSSEIKAVVKVYAPMSSTGWNYIMGCPH